MSKTITIDVLRQVANDSISVYDALKRAHTLTEESKRILTMAEDLLRQAGLAYVPAIPVSKSAPANYSSSARKEMVSAYTAIQQSYADLKDALYHLAKAHIAAKRWDEARSVLEALIKIDTEYRDVANILRQSFLGQAKALFDQKQWEEGRAILKQRSADKEFRLAYLFSFLEEMPLLEDGLRALQIEEPRTSQLPSYQQIMSGEFRNGQNQYRIFMFSGLNRDILKGWTSGYTPKDILNSIDSAYQEMRENLRAELSSIV